jgi:hypothetical protein
MTDDQLQQLLTAANPLTAERAEGLELAEAQDELLARVMERERGRASGRLSRARRPRVLTRVGLAIGATAVVLVALLSLRDGSSDRGSGTAWAAEQIRFAEASPLVLLGAPGWQVEYANEESGREGELRFRLGPIPPPPDLSVPAVEQTPPLPADTSAAELHWRSGPMRHWVDDRASGAAATATAPVLGTTARVYQYEGGTPGHRDITSLFRYDGRVLEFRAGAADIDAFKVLLAKLKRVDADTWLSAMPASVVKRPDRNTTVTQMLQGVTVPPGFSPSDIKGADLTKDRYQLGAAVVGTVACQWFKQWSHAREANDSVKEREAIAGLATAEHWPILEEMGKSGAYPDVLLEYVAAMPSGEWYGRPLIGDVDSGLGCDGLGVKLPQAG